MRDQFAGHPHYERTREFCEFYDSHAFDKQAKTLPLSEFEPMLARVLSEPRHSVPATEQAGDPALNDSHGVACRAHAA